MMQRKPFSALSRGRRLTASVVRSAPASAALLGAVVSFASAAPAMSRTTPSTKNTPAATSNASALAGVRLYVDPHSNAVAQARKWQNSKPREAELMRRIADQPMANWFADWSGDVRGAVNSVVSAAAASGTVPALVAYNIPKRDCGSYSAGGAKNASAYKSWIRSFADGIGRRRAIVILEPDALAGMSCLSASDRATRVDLLSDAVNVLKTTTGATVYLDAGHSNWVGASDIAQRLQQAGIGQADGFSLNVSNFQTTTSNVSYGRKVSALVGGKHFVIDTSRNGNGGSNEWCNPSGVALGEAPTTSTGQALVDAFLWVKRPGESDGTCNGGPHAGQWWPEYVLGMAQRSPVQLFAMN